MRLILALLAALLLAGCGEQPRVWNPGGVPVVTASSSALVHRDGLQRHAPCPAGQIIAAWNDREAQEIRLPDDTSRRLLAALTLHEFGHQVEVVFPEVWRYLNAMHAVGFPCGEDGMP